MEESEHGALKVTSFIIIDNVRLMTRRLKFSLTLVYSKHLELDVK